MLKDVSDVIFLEQALGCPIIKIDDVIHRLGSLKLDFPIFIND